MNFYPENFMKIQVIRYLMLVLALSIAAIIFLFSAENGEKSGSLSDNLAEKILQLWEGSHQSISDENHQQAVVSVGSIFRKLAHFIEYFALGAAFCGFFSTFSLNMFQCGLFSAGISILYAASDELHQFFVPGRNASFWDVLLDSAGAICGVLAVLGVVWLIRRRHGVAAGKEMDEENPLSLSE